MTYRERRQAKAERLRDWAAKRTEQAEAQLASGEPMRSDWAFITQPGHIPARARMIAGDDRAYASLRKAEGMASRADGIEAQLDSSIYSDDPDAIERLEERIAGLEAKREAYKAHNKAHRKGQECACEDDCACKDRWSVTRCGCTKHPLPAYVLTNLSGNIARQRQRLEQLKRRAS